MNLLKDFYFIKQLSFLIRDWQFPDEYAFGFEGGEKLLDQRLEVTITNI